MAIPIHSNFLLFVAAEAFFCIRLHVGPQLSCCSGMVGWFFTADPAYRAAITAFARRSPFRLDAWGRPNHSCCTERRWTQECSLCAMRPVSRSSESMLPTEQGAGCRDFKGEKADECLQSSNHVRVLPGTTGGDSRTRSQG